MLNFITIMKYISQAKWAASFRYHDFRLLWGSTVIQSVSFGMERVGLGWLIFEMTDSVFMLGVATAANMAPAFFLGIVSGAVADWANRKVFVRFLVLAAGGSASLMALVLLTGVAQVWHVLGLAILTGTVSAFLMTVRQAYTYDITGPDHALNGMALSSVSSSLGGIGGALLGGVLISILGIGAQYLAVAAIYGLSVVVLMGTRNVGQAAVHKRGSVVENLESYVQLLRVNHTLITLMVMTATIEIFGFSHYTLLPVFARDVLGVGATGLGVMTAVGHTGGVLGVMVLANLGNFRRKGLLVFVITTGFGLGLMAFSITSQMLFFLAILAWVNGCAMSLDTLNRTLMQEIVPNEQRGRAMGSWTLSIGTGPVGKLGVGVLGEAIGAPRALLVNGAILAFLGFSAAVVLPKIRRLP
jgi:MFS family permease